MATDKHYNEPGVVDEALEDHEPTDMPATRSIFIVVAILAALSIAILVVLQISQ
ncbi:MAG: hypothetical protein IPM46_11365 [Flavobacteriales bacterium]|nr:hypothetical protein [Flavobacteriales bacterium]